MAKKILALVSALALIVCAVSVFTVISVSADSTVADDFKAEIGAYPTAADDWTAYGNAEYLAKSANEDGSVHLEINTDPTWARPTWHSKEVAIDGAHIIVKNVSSAKNRFTLGLNADGSNGREGQVWIIFNGDDGSVRTMNGKWGAEGSPVECDANVIKGVFAEGAVVSIKMDVADNGGLNLEVTNAVGTSRFLVPACLGGDNRSWLENPAEGEEKVAYVPTTAKIGFAEWNASLNFVTKLDVVALHGGDKECVKPLDFTPDIEKYAPTADQFVNKFGEYGETADAHGSKISAGEKGVIVDIKSCSTATIGAGLNKEFQLDGAHIILGAYTDYGPGSGIPTIAVGSKLNDTFDKANIIKFSIGDGRVYTYPSGGGDTLIEAGNEVIKAMATMDSCVSFSVDAEGKVIVSVTNAAGTAVSTPIPNYGTEWTDHTKGYFLFCEHGAGQGKMIKHNVLAVHGGDEACEYSAGAADKVVAQINALGTVTSASKAAVEAAEKAYALLSNKDKATVTNYEVLTAARAALDVCLAADVDALIAAIGTVENTEECGAKITAAEEAYAALTAAQKELVTKKADLGAARAEYDEISGKNAADQAAADAVDALIDAIGEVAFTDECLAKITAAEEAYAALTDAQKARVAKYDVLTAARKSYDVQNDAKFRYEYNIEIPVKSGDVTTYHAPPTWIEDTELGCLVEAMDKSDSHWAGRNGYQYAVGFEGLQIKFKGLDKMNDTISLALHDEPGAWTDSTGALITFLIYRNGGDGYGYVRAHNAYNGDYENKTPNPVWMTSFEEDVWADNEMLVEFAIVDDTYGTVFFDGQRMGDFLLSDLGLEDLEKCYVNFHHWSAGNGKSSYCVYSITCKAQADAVTAVEEAIKNIGTVDANDEECVARIEAAEELYKGLAKNLRKLVANIDVLDDALAILDGETPTEEPTEEPTEDPTEEPTEEPTENPKTGEAVAVLPIALLIAAAGAVVISRKRK